MFRVGPIKKYAYLGNIRCSTDKDTIETSNCCYTRQIKIEFINDSKMTDGGNSIE
jgi:hypothetical protein